MSRLVRSAIVVFAFSTVMVFTVAPSDVSAQSAGTVLPGTQCPAFPADNVWNTPITGLPVNADSATWLASMDASTDFLHPDYGPSGDEDRALRDPVADRLAVAAARPDQVHVRRRRATPALTRCRSRRRSRTAPTGTPSWSTPRPARSTSCGTPATTPRKESTAGSGAIWSLAIRRPSSGRLDVRRRRGTADPARARQLRRGTRGVDGPRDPVHRRSARNRRTSGRPATRPASRTRTARRWERASGCPPASRLPAVECSAMCQTVITTMKTYGLILADNGSNWYFQGTADTRWTEQRGRSAEADPGK